MGLGNDAEMGHYQYIYPRMIPLNGAQRLLILAASQKREEPYSIINAQIHSNTKYTELYIIDE